MEDKTRTRKACDLCYTRKIKCGGQKPRCSNCVTYGTECTHTAQSRQWKPKTRRNAIDSRGEEIQTLQDQIQSLKEQLEAQSAELNEQPNVQPMRMTPLVLAEDQQGCLDSSARALDLPTLQEALPMISVFINNFNSVLPLFHADDLLRLVGQTYALQPQERNPVDWAAINVVLALAEQQVPLGDLGDRRRKDVAIEHFNNAQSVVSTVMLGELRLLNIQTLVGMAMLLQSAHDMTPALILISATMRLAHKMGLHSRAALVDMDPLERRQRDYVFWLAYILDKNLSLRAQQPSVQLDDDIDVDLPYPPIGVEEDSDSDTAGVVMTADGQVKMNYFLARVQLASIEGSVYDSVYSTRALNHTPEQRLTARQSIVNALGEWRASIPPEFDATVVASTTNNNAANTGFFGLLHSTSLQCMVMINRAHAWDAPWIHGLRDHGRGVQKLQLPLEWGALVQQSRDFILFFQQIWSKDLWFRWMTSCSYMSATIIMVADNLYNVQHKGIHADEQLVDSALEWLNDIVEEVQQDRIRGLRDVCVEVVQQTRLRRAEAVAQIGDSVPELKDNWAY